MFCSLVLTGIVAIYYAVLLSKFNKAIVYRRKKK